MGSEIRGLTAAQDGCVGRPDTGAGAEEARSTCCVVRVIWLHSCSFLSSRCRVASNDAAEPSAGRSVLLYSACKPGDVRGLPCPLTAVRLLELSY